MNQENMKSVNNRLQKNVNLTAIINELKKCGYIPQVVLKSLAVMFKKYSSTIHELFNIVKTYEGKNAGLSNIEHSLLNFKDQYDMAKSIQNCIFPKNLPDNPLISVNAELVSMFETTGDFYDVVELLPNKVYGVLLSDISGHGVSAALVTHMLKILLEKAVEIDTSPKVVLRYLNEKFYKILRQRSFFTAFYSIIDFPNKRFIYSSAGHTYALWYNSVREELIKVDTRGMGMVIGVCDGIIYDEKEIDFNRGDRFITYTDGVIEARNKDKELYGEDRLFDLIKCHVKAPSKELIRIIEENLKSFTGKEKFDDDLTILVTDIKGGKVETQSGRNLQYKNDEIESVTKYYKSSIRLKKKRKDFQGAIKDKINLSEIYLKKGEYRRALNYLLKAETSSIELKDGKLIGDSSVAIATAYMRMGQQSKGFEYAYNALKYYKKLNDERGIQDSFIVIANLYDRIGDPINERDYLFKALEISNKSSYSSRNRVLARIYNSIGVSYANESNQNEALNYYHKSLDIAEKYGFLDATVVLINNIGDIYRQQARYDESLKYFHKALYNLEEIENKELNGIILYNIATIYKKLEDYPMAFYYLRKGYKIARKYSMSHLISLVKSFRAYLFLKIGNIKKCLKDIKHCIYLNEKLKYDPQQGFIYTVMGILLSMKEISLTEKEKNMINFIISKINKGGTNPDYYFNIGIEKSFTPLHTDTHIPSLYEYAKYLYKKGDYERSREMFNEALKLSLIFGNYSEKKEIEKIFNDLNIDKKLFCEDYKSNKE